MGKNLKWAQENNELTNQLMDIEKELIQSKLHIANLASMNDRLTHSNSEKSKKIKKMNYYLNKYNIEIPKESSKTLNTNGSV